MRLRVRVVSNSVTIDSPACFTVKRAENGSLRWAMSQTAITEPLLSEHYIVRGQRNSQIPH